MNSIKWQVTFQLFIIMLGLSFGVYFSTKANTSHDESHGALLSHSTMDHGYIDVSNDPIIPKIEEIELIKDPMSGWNLHIITKNFQFTPANASSKHVPGCGHAHLMINGIKVARVYSNWFHIPELGYPIKKLEVTLNANSHAIMSANEKTIALKVNYSDS